MARLRVRGVVYYGHRDGIRWRISDIYRSGADSCHLWSAACVSEAAHGCATKKVYLTRRKGGGHGDHEDRYDNRKRLGVVDLLLAPWTPCPQRVLRGASTCHEQARSLRVSFNHDRAELRALHQTVSRHLKTAKNQAAYTCRTPTIGRRNLLDANHRAHSLADRTVQHQIGGMIQRRRLAVHDHQ